MPQIMAPVQRETSATVSRDGNAITPTIVHLPFTPSASDDAE